VQTKKSILVCVIGKLGLNRSEQRGVGKIRASTPMGNRGRERPLCPTTKIWGEGKWGGRDIKWEGGKGWGKRGESTGFLSAGPSEPKNRGSPRKKVPPRPGGDPLEGKKKTHRELRIFGRRIKNRTRRGHTDGSV